MVNLEEIEDREVIEMMERLLGFDFYDSSLLERLKLEEDVKGKRVLDIGAGSLNSSFDFALAGANEVVVFEPRPFHLMGINDPGYAEAVEFGIGYLLSKKRFSSAPKLRVSKKFLGNGERNLDEFGEFDRAFFFFPSIPSIGNQPDYDEGWINREFGCLVSSVCEHLSKGGKFRIITEVPKHNVRYVEVAGFDRKIETYPGVELYSEKERVNGWARRGTGNNRRVDPEPVRPASSLSLTVIEYSHRR